MFNRNIIFPLCIIVLSVITLFIIGNFDQPRYRDASIDASFFPTVIVIAQIIICLGLIVQFKLKKEIESNQPKILSKGAILGFLLLISYAVIIYIFGYIIASLTVFTLYLASLKITKPAYYVIAWSFVFIIYYLFSEIFVISLPESIFF